MVGIPPGIYTRFTVGQEEASPLPPPVSLLGKKGACCPPTTRFTVGQERRPLLFTRFTVGLDLSLSLLSRFTVGLDLSLLSLFPVSLLASYPRLGMKTGLKPGGRTTRVYHQDHPGDTLTLLYPGLFTHPEWSLPALYRPMVRMSK